MILKDKKICTAIVINKERETRRIVEEGISTARTFITLILN